MTKAEFVKLQKEDLVSEDNSILNAVLKCLIRHLPENVSVSSDKSVQGMYDAMENYARKNKLQCIDPDITFIEIMNDYFNTKGKKNVSLEDFF